MDKVRKFLLKMFQCKKARRKPELIVPMTKTQFMQKRCVWKCMISAWLSYTSWDKSKNPCPCGNHIFPNLVHHQNLDSTWPAACFPGPDDAARWTRAWYLLYFLKLVEAIIDLWQYRGCGRNEALILLTPITVNVCHMLSCWTKT